MFFFIGGIQPKTVSLEQDAGICPACGLAQAALKRTDLYLSLFFIPLFPVKKGDPVLICNRCGVVSPRERHLRQDFRIDKNCICPKCGYPLGPDFRFCPSCGTKYNEA